MKESVMTLNLAGWKPRSVANGPGVRCVLWVQGCLRQCEGCCNDQMQVRARRHEVAVGRLAERILAMPGIEGVTYSGGEPMLQARSLAVLSQLLKSAGLSVMCFTGYTLDQLRAKRRRWIEQLLSQVDILIDGPYDRSQAANLLWRGSDNQQVHFLTGRYRHLAGQIDRRPSQVEVTVGENAFLTTGTWPEGFVTDLEIEIHRGAQP